MNQEKIEFTFDELVERFYILQEEIKYDEDLLKSGHFSDEPEIGNDIKLSIESSKKELKEIEDYLESIHYF